MRDYSAAARYIRNLTGDAHTPMTFQVFDDSPDKREMARVIHGTLQANWNALARANDAGGGIFVAVNECDGNGRKAANVVRVRALHIDCDGRIPASFHLEPTMVVLSANGIHAYWNVADCGLGDFKAAQRRLIAHYGSDAHVCDLPRVLRVPGFYHCKREPFMVEVLQEMPGVYSLADVMQGLPDAEPEFAAPPAPRGADGDARWRGALRWMQMRDPAVEGQGGRLHTLKTTTRLANLGVSFDDAWSLLARWNQDCAPPWREHELHALLQSAWQKSHR